MDCFLTKRLLNRFIHLRIFHSFKSIFAKIDSVYFLLLWELQTWNSSFFSLSQKRSKWNPTTTLCLTASKMNIICLIIMFYILGVFISSLRNGFTSNWKKWFFAVINKYEKIKPTEKFVRGGGVSDRVELFALVKWIHISPFFFYS